MAALEIMSTDGILSKIIREELVPNMMELEPGIDPLFSKLNTTAQGVEVDRLGRGFNYIQTFITGLGGSYKNVAAIGPTDIVTDQANTRQINTWDQSKVRRFPGLSRNVDPGYVQKTVSLVQGMGSITFPLHFYMGTRLSAAIMDPIKIKMKRTARMLLQSDAASIYSESATTHAFATLRTGAVAGTKAVYTDTSAGTNTALPGHLVIKLDDPTLVHGRVARLLPGQSVSFIDATGPTDVGWGVVVNNDYLVTKAITIWFPSGLGGTTIADGDYLIQSDSYTDSISHGVSGFAKWFQGTGGSAYGLNFDNHPMFKSLITSLSGAVLDETQLNTLVGAFLDAYGDMYSLDGAVGTMGGLAALLDSFEGLGRYQRQGQGLNVKMGWTKIGYQGFGEEFDFAASRYQTPGQWYIWKFNNNLKRLIPPSPEGVTTHPGFSREVLFVAPWLGSKTIFLPERYTPTIAESGSATHTDVGALTEFQIAPFVTFREYCPEQLPGIKVTDAAENTV